MLKVRMGSPEVDIVGAGLLVGAQPTVSVFYT